MSHMSDIMAHMSQIVSHMSHNPSHNSVSQQRLTRSKMIINVKFDIHIQYAINNYYLIASDVNCY